MRLIDADALSEKLCKTTIFIKDGSEFQRMIHDAPTVSAETHDKRTETHGVCSDLISRADAMGAVQDHFNADGFKGYDDGQQMMDRIKSLPSADITETETCQRCQDLTDTILNRQGDEIKRLKAEARPTGEWTITLTDDGFGGENTHLICSVCGSEPLAWSSRKFFRYCPSCGAKMGGGDSE